MMNLMMTLLCKEFINPNVDFSEIKKNRSPKLLAGALQRCSVSARSNYTSTSAC